MIHFLYYQLHCELNPQSLGSFKSRVIAEKTEKLVKMLFDDQATTWIKTEHCSVSMSKFFVPSSRPSAEQLQELCRKAERVWGGVCYRCQTKKPKRTLVDGFCTHFARYILQHNKSEGENVPIVLSEDLVFEKSFERFITTEENGDKVSKVVYLIKEGEQTIETPSHFCFKTLSLLLDLYKENV